MDNNLPLIAIIKRPSNAIDTRPFYTQDEFLTYCNTLNPAWATLINDRTGDTVLQVSYPQ